mmetsp:Transcript_83907/g.246057  ORF Transcript_83907/g.246057 Transcript_83907/m.246057 type:complete len:212 (+) Transcript_83907:574-1209(+)
MLKMRAFAGPQVLAWKTCKTPTISATRSRGAAQDASSTACWNPFELPDPLFVLLSKARFRWHRHGSSSVTSRQLALRLPFGCELCVFECEDDDSVSPSLSVLAAPEAVAVAASGTSAAGAVAATATSVAAAAVASSTTMVTAGTVVAFGSRAANGTRSSSSWSCVAGSGAAPLGASFDFGALRCFAGVAFDAAARGTARSCSDFRGVRVHG